MQKLAAILLVDDDPTSNYLNQLLLEELAVADQLLVATNGAEALHILTHVPPPATAAAGPVLVLLDVNMPVMNGLEFLEAYQQLPPDRWQAVVIVMLTTSLHPRDLARLQALPVAGLVSKPLSEEKINAILREHFQRELPTR